MKINLFVILLLVAFETANTMQNLEYYTEKYLWPSGVVLIASMRLNGSPFISMSFQCKKNGAVSAIGYDCECEKKINLQRDSVHREIAREFLEKLAKTFDEEHH